MGKAKTEEVNKAFYDEVYQSRGFFSEKIVPLISYDQLCKSRRNIAALLRFYSGSAQGETRVFDFGCGRGVFLRNLPIRPLAAYGLDLSDQAIANLQRYNWGAGRSFTALSSDDFYSDETSLQFDVVSSSHVLEHVPDDKLVLTRMLRLLAPGGYLVLNLPVNEVWQDPNHVREYDEQAVRALLENHDLEILSLELEDRWTAFLLYHEQVRSGGVLKKLALRTLRAALALLPVNGMRFSEKILPARYLPQQLILVARKADA